MDNGAFVFLSQWMPLPEIYDFNFCISCNIVSETEEISYNQLFPTIRLDQNYPNPFNPATTNKYSISELKDVELKIYYIKGQLVRTLLNETKTAGEHFIVWDGYDQSNLIVP